MSSKGKARGFACGVASVGKLNVRVADLMEQINIVIKVLVDENMELRAKLDSIKSQQQEIEIKK